MLYYIRAFFILGFFLLFCSVATLLALLSPFNSSNTRNLLKFFKPAYWIGNIKVEGINADSFSGKPVIYITNHQDLLDIFMFSQIFPKNTVVIGKRSLLLIPFFGTAFWLCGNIFINRKDKSSSWELMKHLSESIHEKNHSILFMPEGTRSKGRGLLPFKLGAFSVAINAGVDIVPICASSTDKINLHVLSPKKAYVEYLSPISTQGLDESNIQQLADQCHQLMKNKIEALDHRIEQESEK